MWARLLGCGLPESGEDFFDLGGDSLSLVALVNEVYQCFRVELPVDELFASGFTVVETARLIHEAVAAGEAER
jgi:acyl carrier protein